MNNNPNADIDVATRLGSATQLVSRAEVAGTVQAEVYSRAVAQSEQQFSLALLKHLASQKPAPVNLVVSPPSLLTTLAMLELGACGDTQAQIASTLNSGHLTAHQQAAGWSLLSAELSADERDYDVAIESANSLWIQQGLAMDPRFMSNLSQYFESGVWQVNFASDPVSAVNSLNAWVSQETHGHITSLFGPETITSQTALVLANAVYFKAKWAEPFMGDITDGTFFPFADTPLSVPYMRSAPGQPINVLVSTRAELTAVQLPYAGGRVAALVMMPTARSVWDLAGSLTSASLSRYISGLVPAAVNMAMPTLSLSDSHGLVPTLQALGMKDAFTGSADFSDMVSVSLAVTDVVQRATLDVTDWGTEAAAATGIAMAASARPASMTLAIEHPFLFLIRDTKNGTILFEAMVTNPEAG